MVEIGAAKMLGDSWFLVSSSGRYEISVNEVWRLKLVEGQRYRFTPGADGWALQ